MNAVVLDSGAVTAWAEAEEGVVTLLLGVRRKGGVVIVPTVVLAESMTGNGSRDAAVHLCLRTTHLDPCEFTTAVRAAGLRSAVGGRGLAIDAIVVATAEKHRAVLLTADRDDLRRLADAGGSRVQVMGLNESGAKR